MCVIHDRRLQRRAINRPAGSSSPLKQAILIIAGFSLLQLIALKFISGRPTVVNDTHKQSGCCVSETDCLRQQYEGLHCLSH